MSNNGNTYRTVSIIALVLGVLGVTLGYAAFSSTLTISSEAEVHPDSSKFNVDFSSSDASVQTNAITPTLSTTADGFSATNATLDNTTDPTATNIKATFTEPGQSVTYSFYSFNAGEYVAYLNSVTFDGTKTCTAGTGTTQSLVDTACTGITLTAQVGTTGPTSTTVADISSHSLGIGAAEPVTIVISYADDAGIADGDFTVSFPDVVLRYDSAD